MKSEVRFSKKSDNEKFNDIIETLNRKINDNQHLAAEIQDLAEGRLLFKSVVILWTLCS